MEEPLGQMFEFDKRSQCPANTHAITLALWAVNMRNPGLRLSKSVDDGWFSCQRHAAMGGIEAVQMSSKITLGGCGCGMAP